MSNSAYPMPIGPIIMAVGSLGALVVTLVDYLAPMTGVSYTGGALLVVGSSACLLVGSILEMIGWIRQHWTGPTLTVLIILGIIGTAVAAYFLEAWWLEVAVAVVFVGWLTHLFWHPSGRTEREARREAHADHRTHQMHGAHP